MQSTMRKPIKKTQRQAKANHTRRHLTRQIMTPISMRITSSQQSGLELLRSSTGLPAREHIRRAIDAYLAKHLD